MRLLDFGRDGPYCERRERRSPQHLCQGRRPVTEGAIDVQTDPTDGSTPTDAPEPSGDTTPAATGSDPGAGIPTDPAVLGTGLVPDGWQIVEDATTTCRIAVPGD